MTPRWASGVAAVLATTFLAGCTAATLNRSPYVNQAALEEFLRARPNKSPDEVKFLKEFPKDTFVVLGTLHAPEREWTALYTMDDLLKAMRSKAAELGADAIVDFRSRENPTVQSTGYIHPVSGGSVTTTYYKGLHAWGEAIVFAPADRKKQIEP